MPEYVLLGSVLIVLGNLVRLSRWKRLLGKDAIKRGLPETSLGMSNLLNNYLPFRSGDVARIFFVSGRDKQRLLAVVASLIIERIFDIFSLCVIFVLISLNTVKNSETSTLDIWYPTWIYVLATVLILATLRTIFKGHAFFKHCVRIATLPLSQKLRHSIFYIALGISENTKKMLSKEQRVKILYQTIFLWILYFAGYQVLTAGLTDSTNRYSNDIFLKQFSPNGIIGNNSVNNMTKIAVILVPNLVLLILGVVLTVKNSNSKGKYKKPDTNRFEFLPFMHKSVEFEFLNKYFSGKESDWCRAYRDVHQGIHVVRDVSGLSGARTALIQNQDNNMAYRKYAIGSGEQELAKQVEWLEEMLVVLPVARVLKTYEGKNYFAYDMESEVHSEEVSSACGWLPVQKTIDILQTVISDLEKSLYVESNPVTPLDAAAYLENKLYSVLETFIEFPQTRNFSSSDSLNINGVLFASFKNVLSSLKTSGIEKLLTFDNASKAHGDLTLKNIIYSPTRPGQYFLIDPSTSDTYMSKFQDYAKILQSVLSSYESTATSSVEIFDDEENNISKIKFINGRSEVYGFLNSWFINTYLNQLKTEEQLVIQLHLVVHWARMCRHRVEAGDPDVLKYALILLVQCNNMLEDYDSSSPLASFTRNFWPNDVTNNTSIPAL